MRLADGNVEIVKHGEEGRPSGYDKGSRDIDS